MSASNPSGRAFRRVAIATTLAIGLLASSFGCGGSSNGTNVLLPPGGVAIGNLVCTGTAQPPTNMVAQGQAITIRFTLTDVNINLVGANLPVSFDVVGGTLADPPNATDDNGVVVVTFIADDDFVGAGRVRLIGPEARLDCDVAFTVSQGAPTLTSETLDGADAIVTPSDACGSTEANVERQQVRKIRFLVTRPNPVTGVVEPVPGAFIRLTAVGATFTEMVIGPTDANGQVTQVITPFATGQGTATVTAEVVRPDVDGPNGGPDGLPDTLPSNICVVKFQIINPICDANGNAATFTVRDAFGNAKASPVRPGESADVTASFVVDGMPQAGRSILVDAADGFINGSANPVAVLTDGAGQVTVTFTPRQGFSGNDTVTFQDNIGTLTCTQTATIPVVTCDIALEFVGGPPCSGCTVPVIIRVLNVDPATALGEIVALDTVGGGFTAQPPTGPLVPDGGGVPSITTTLNITPGFTGPAAISLSFISGYACDSTTENFTVVP